MYTDNRNNIGETGISANKYGPDKTAVGLGEYDYTVRVKVCASSDLIGDEKCRQYPDDNYKPVGLLQVHGENENYDYMIKFKEIIEQLKK